MYKLICSYIWHLFSTHYTKSMSLHIKKNTKCFLTDFSLFYNHPKCFYQIYLPPTVPLVKLLCAEKCLCMQVTPHGFKNRTMTIISISLSQNNFNTSCYKPVCYDPQVSPHRNISFLWLLISQPLSWVALFSQLPHSFYSRKHPLFRETNAVISCLYFLHFHS